MRGYAHWLAPIVALGVAAYLVIFLVKVNQTDPLPAMEPILLESDLGNQTSQGDDGWPEALAKHERQGSFYPVNEIYVEIDLNQRLVNETTYRLSAELRDPYQLFCLKQELKRHGLRYTLAQDAKKMRLLVHSKKRDALIALVESLKNYQITATFLPHQEDQQWKNIK